MEEQAKFEGGASRAESPDEKILIYAGDGRCYWKQDHCAIFEQGRQVRIAAGQEVACRGCGWYSEAWCTACQDKAELQELYKAVQGGRS